MQPLLITCRRSRNRKALMPCFPLFRNSLFEELPVLHCSDKSFYNCKDYFSFMKFKFFEVVKAGKAATGLPGRNGRLSATG